MGVSMGGVGTAVLFSDEKWIYDCMVGGSTRCTSSDQGTLTAHERAFEYTFLLPYGIVNEAYLRRY